MLAAPLKDRTIKEERRMKKLIIPILLLALLLLLIPATASAASGVQVVSKTGDGNWTGDTWKVTMYPGEQKSTVVTFKNPSLGDIALALSATPSTFDDGNVIISLDNSTLIVPAKSEACAVISASAAGSATPRTYSAEIRIEVLPPPLSVTTNDARWITVRGATLNGRLDDLGSFDSVSVSFEWGTSPGSLDKETHPRPKRRVGVFRARLPRLSPNTTYYFRAKAEGDGTIVYGDEFNFTTKEHSWWFWWW